MSFKQYIKDIRRILNPPRENYKVYLGQNERNLPLPDEMFTKFKKQIIQEDLMRYPDLTELKTKLEQHINIPQNQMLLTPGSDIALKTVFEAFNLKGKNIVTTDYHFPMYGVYTDLNGCKLRTVPYTCAKFDLENLLNTVDKDTAFIIIANPNSPLGDSYELEDIQKVLATGIQVVVDEAYIELSYANSSLELLQNYDNLTVLRTFSKGFGAAGCRVGYLVSSVSNMQYYSKLRFMYEVSTISAKYCNFILDNIVYFQNYTKEVVKEKELLHKKIEEAGYKTINTDSSWFFIQKNSKIEKIIQENSIDLRTINLTFTKEKEWYKFNYDLFLNHLNFQNKILNETNI